MNNTELKAITYGVKVKINRGESLDDILTSYVNLTEKEKEYIRNAI